MKQKKAYKYRFYPSDEQKRLLAQTFGCCRYVYNWALRQRTDAYYQHGERLYYEGTAQRLVTLKKPAMWPSLSTTSPDIEVLSAAPTPETVPTRP